MALNVGARRAVLGAASAGASSLAFSGAGATTATVDATYDAGLAAANGTGPYTYSIAPSSTWTAAQLLALGLTPTSGGLGGKPLRQFVFTGIKCRVTDSLGATADSAAFNLTVGPNTVDGVQVGGAGAGIYSGYTLIWADDFLRTITDDLIVGPANPNGRWFVPKNYTPGARANHPRLGMQYDADPLHTGFKNQGRGVAVGFSGVTVAASQITLAAKLMSDAERWAASCLGSFIQTGGILGEGAIWFDPRTAGTQDFIIDIKGSFPSAPPAGYHGTMWTESVNPMAIQSPSNGGTGSGDELDWVECNSTLALMSRHGWTAGVDSPAAGPGSMTPLDGIAYVWTAKQNTTNFTLYKDGVSQPSFPFAGSTNTKSLSQSVFVTNHVLNFSFDAGGGAETMDVAAWQAIGASSYPIIVDYIRVWSKSGTHYRPQVVVDPVNIDSGAGGTLVMPASATLWGTGGLTEYAQVIPTEADEPGVTQRMTTSRAAPGADTFTQYPTGVSLASRTFTITSAVVTPGRMNIVVGVQGAGISCEPMRTWINVGPTISIPDHEWAVGQVIDIDCYFLADCGTLCSTAAGTNAVTFVLTGSLPPGLSFSTTTFKVTGTIGVGASGTYNWGLTVTNSVGQTASDSCTTTIATLYTHEKVNNVAWYCGEAGWVEKDGSNNILRLLNKAKLGAESNLQTETNTSTGAAGTGTVTYSAAAKNSRDIIVMDTGTGTRMMARPGDPVSRIFHGDDPSWYAFYAFKKTATNAGTLFAAGRSINGTSFEARSLNMRADASSTRFEQNVGGVNTTTTGGNATQANITNGQERVLGIRYNGATAEIAIWWNQSTKTTATNNAAAFSNLLTFMIGGMFAAATTSSGSVWFPSFATSNPDMELYDAIFNTGFLTGTANAADDTAMAQGVADWQTKWAITPT